MNTINYGLILACSLLGTLGFTACENTKVDDQAAKELNEAGEKIERKAEQAGKELRSDTNEGLEKAESRLSDLDTRWTKAKARAKAEGREANETLEKEIAQAKAKAELKAKQVKQSAAKGSSDAIAELQAALDELDAKIAAYDAGDGADGAAETDGT